MTDREKSLVPLDPESESCFQLLTRNISDELGARLAIGDDPSTPEGLKGLSELIADRILDQFTVRVRNTRRYLWKSE